MYDLNNAAVFARAGALLATLLITGCAPEDAAIGDPGSAASVDTRPVVVAVNYPLAWMVERLGGDTIRVELPVPPGSDPANWTPTPEQLVELKDADLILLNGAGYSRWVATAGLPNSRLIDTTRNVRARLIREEDLPTHSQVPGGERGQGGWAITTWLDPRIAIAQAMAVRNALQTNFPAETTDIDAHYTVLERELLEVDKALETAFAALGGQPLLFSQPVYQYLERRYGLNGRSLHWQPDRFPGDDGVVELRAVLGEHPARIMLWDDYIIQVTVDLLETEGIRSLVFRTGANRPETGDYLDLMRANLANLQRAVELTQPPQQPGDTT